jgi:hypothetical protein
MKRLIHDFQGRLCGCCEGTQQLTPRPIANRPSLEALAYRMGTQAAFLETMKARLSDFYLDIKQDDLDAEGKPKTTRVYPLRGLTTRAAEDPSIALLDAWATLADVLTFYQERIANEGYLRTATERRSILELARLVGYALRPGVASTVYLAYTLDDNAKEPVIIPVGARAQSVPGPGELPQSFETVEELEAAHDEATDGEHNLRFQSAPTCLPEGYQHWSETERSAAARLRRWRTGRAISRDGCQTRLRSRPHEGESAGVVRPGEV